jgi:hypothetical protein
MGRNLLDIFGVTEVLRIYRPFFGNIYKIKTVLNFIDLNFDNTWK